MNQFSQQSGMYQGQQGYHNQNTNFQPSGFVQSHYQGQLSQPSFGRPSNSIVPHQPNAFQATNSYGQNGQYGMSTGYSSMSQPTAMNNSFISHQPVQSYAQSPATAFGNVGPVIAHVGYQAGSDSQHSFYQPTQSTMGMGTQYTQQNNQYGQQATSNYGYTQPNAGGAGSYGGMTQTQSNQSSYHPVYQATNAYEQAGPVIGQLGYQAGRDAQSSPYSGNMR
ncbi:hypothetical protein [Paenibacillus sp. sgz302251]|uniref:hypothetical protein n=1 Tax=Paenibacillus sp. sgz302251 TaxID=3414493 RepID=UPI003C7B9649